MTEPLDLEDVNQQAIAWVVRVNDAAFADWDAFQEWLDAAPAHAEAYHAAALAEADMVAALAAEPWPVEEIEAPAAPRPRRWAAWGGLALAASLSAVLLYRAEMPAAL